MSRCAFAAENTFGSVDKCTRGLTQLPCYERAGLLFENHQNIAGSMVFDSLFARENDGMNWAGVRYGFRFDR